MSPLNEPTFWAELPSVLLQEMQQEDIGAFLFSGTVLFLGVAIFKMGWTTLSNRRSSLQ